MSKEAINAAVISLKRVIAGELDDAERAIRNANPERARRELDGVDKIKRIIRNLQQHA